MALSRLLLPRFHTAASHRLLCSAASAQSELYTHALKTQRPTTVPYLKRLCNSISLIGVLASPFKEFRTTNNSFVFNTQLTVPGGVYGHFRVPINFFNDIGKTAAQHLKHNDFVYVAGRLNYYVVKDGIEDHTGYSVNVSEFNFVDEHGLGKSFLHSMKLEKPVSAEDMMEKRRKRLHLWQIYFRSPHEWWDNRNRKTHKSAPDFSHKSTGEALWLQGNDPPWVKRQLELQDSMSSSPFQGGYDKSRLLSPLVFDEL